MTEQIWECTKCGVRVTSPIQVVEVETPHKRVNGKACRGTMKLKK